MAADNNELDDFEKINNMMLQSYDPSIPLLEPPKENIWEQIKEDNAEKDKKIEENRQIKKYEASTGSSSSTKSSSSYKGIKNQYVNYCGDEGKVKITNGDKKYDSISKYTKYIFCKKNSKKHYIALSDTDILNLVA
jgi:hypothetical protein